MDNGGGRKGVDRLRGKLNLTGQRFGKLTAMVPAENVNGRTTWQCRCDCGRELVVETVRLRAGHTKSCGCCRVKHALHPTYIDGTSPEMLLAAKIARKNNTSGVPGVDWVASKQLWRAAICFKGRRYYLGGYHRFEDAVAARKRGEAELHDRFLRELAVNMPAKAANG